MRRRRRREALRRKSQVEHARISERDGAIRHGSGPLERPAPASLRGSQLPLCLSERRSTNPGGRRLPDPIARFSPLLSPRKTAATMGSVVSCIGSLIDNCCTAVESCFQAVVNCFMVSSPCDAARRAVLGATYSDSFVGPPPQGVFRSVAACVRGCFQTIARCLPC